MQKKRNKMGPRARWEMVDNRLVIIRGSVGGSPHDQSWARLETGAVFSCGVLLFCLFGFAIDQPGPTARWLACGHSMLCLLHARPSRVSPTSPPGPY